MVWRYAPVALAVACTAPETEDPAARPSEADDADADTEDPGLTPGELALLCSTMPTDPRCGPPGEVCPTEEPLLAYAWVTPRHWPNGAAPPTSPVVAAEEVAIHQGANLPCDWRNNNASPGCSPSTSLAQNLDDLATRLATRPAGRRSLLWRAWGNENMLHADPADFTVPGPSAEPAQAGIHWDAGAAETATVSKALFAGLQARGVTVDYLFIDSEWSLSNWQMGTCNSPDPAQLAREVSRWRAVAEDPRTPAMLAEWASGFGTDPSVALQHQLCPIAYGTDRYLQWNAFMHERAARWYTEALFTEGQAVFPKLVGSNYDFAYSDPAYAIPDINGHDVMRFGQGAIVGTHQSPPCYGELGQVSDQIVPRISSTAIYARTAFNSFRFAVNQYRSRALARPDVPMAPWIAPSDYSDSGRVPHANGPLYDELLLHLGVSGPDALIYWNNGAPAHADAAVEAGMYEVNRLAGCGGRAHRFDALAAWDAPWVVSGVDVDGGDADGDRVIWRFTADDPTVLLQRDGPDLVAQSGMRRIVFPDAWIVPGPFARGAWVVQASGAAPPVEE